MNGIQKRGQFSLSAYEVLDDPQMKIEEMPAPKDASINFNSSFVAKVSNFRKHRRKADALLYVVCRRF